jgi:hypothetical protein
MLPSTGESPHPVKKLRARRVVESAYGENQPMPYLACCPECENLVTTVTVLGGAELDRALENNGVIEVVCFPREHKWKLNDQDKTNLRKRIQEDADAVAQDVVNFCAPALRAGHLTGDLEGLLNHAQRYRAARGTADNHREVDQLIEQEAAEEIEARAALVEASKRYREKSQGA